MENKKLYKVLVAQVVDGLSYEAGQTYELDEAQVAAFAENEIELVATPDGDVTPPAPETPAAETPAPEGEVPPAPAPEAPAPEAEKPVEPAKPWPGNHTVGRE